MLCYSTDCGFVNISYSPDLVFPEYVSINSCSFVYGCWNYIKEKLNSGFTSPVLNWLLCTYSRIPVIRTNFHFPGLALWNPYKLPSLIRILGYSNDFFSNLGSNNRGSTVAMELVINTWPSYYIIIIIVFPHTLGVLIFTGNNFLEFLEFRNFCKT